MWGAEPLTTLEASTACYGHSFTFLYVDDVRISQETHLLASAVCYGESFTFLYVDDVRTSQETHLRTSIGFTRVSQPVIHELIYIKKQTPWPLVRKQTIPTERLPFDEI
jgi:hypothetical protein